MGISEEGPRLIEWPEADPADVRQSEQSELAERESAATLVRAAHRFINSGACQVG
jgi:hypothetical protein